MRRSRRPSCVRVWVIATWTIGTALGAPGAVAGQSPVPEQLSLRDAVALAVERNPIMVAARAGVDAAAADRVSASRRPNPAVSVDSNGYPAFESTRPGCGEGAKFERSTGVSV